MCILFTASSADLQKNRVTVPPLLSCSNELLLCDANMLRELKKHLQIDGSNEIPNPTLVLQDVQNEEAANPAKALG
jgi:hypothetical protein